MLKVYKLCLVVVDKDNCDKILLIFNHIILDIRILTFVSFLLELGFQEPALIGTLKPALRRVNNGLSWINVWLGAYTQNNFNTPPA